MALGEPYDGTIARGLQLEHYMRHYLATRKVRSIQGLLSSTRRPRAFAFGNVICFSMTNASQELIHDAMLASSWNLDNWVNSELFSGDARTNVFDSYLGGEVLNRDPTLLRADPLNLSTYLCVFVCDKNEFESFLGNAEKLRLTRYQDSSVLIGKAPASNFVDERFPKILANPVIVLSEEDQDHDHIYDRALLGVLNTAVAIGELHNIHSVLEDVIEWFIVSRYDIGFEISELGRLRFPVSPRFISTLRAVSKLNRIERVFARTAHDAVANIELYGTKAAEILWKSESVHPFHEVVELLGLVNAYGPNIIDLVTLSNNHKIDLDKIFFQEHDGDFAVLRGQVAEFSKTLQELLAQTRTSVQLNIAVGALVWAILVALLNPLIAPQILLLFARIVAALGELPVQLVVVALAILYVTGYLRGALQTTLEGRKSSFQRARSLVTLAGQFRGLRFCLESIALALLFLALAFFAYPSPSYEAIGSIIVGVFALRGVGQIWRTGRRLKQIASRKNLRAVMSRIRHYLHRFQAFAKSFV